MFLLAHLSCLMQDTALPEWIDQAPQSGAAHRLSEHGPRPGALLPFAFLSHSSALLRNAWQKSQCPEAGGPGSAFPGNAIAGPGSAASRALLPWHSQPQGHCRAAIFHMAFFFFPPTCTRSRDGLGCKTLQSSKALCTLRALLGPSPFQSEQEGQVTRQRTKVPGERHQHSHLHTCKGPFCPFFFFPFEISNSSLWTKSCLSENIDLRPLTKLHLKQSRGLFFPLPTDLSAQSLDLPGSCRKFLHWSTPLVLAQRGFCT